MSNSSAFEVAIVHSYFGSPSTFPSTYVSHETLRDRETRVASSGEVRVNPAALKHRGTGIAPNDEIHDNLNSSAYTILSRWPQHQHPFSIPYH